MKKRLLGYYDYTVVLTYCGMLFAFYGILCVLEQNFWRALFCLMLSGVCDMFDGTVAATKDRTEKEKCFGIQIDSLSDLISFGVLPGIFVYVLCGQSRMAGIVAAAFVLCALIRLAYFNVLEAERQRQTTEKRKSYLGVPVTTVAVLLPALYLLYDRQICRRVVCFPLLLLLTGIGYILPVEIKKPGALGKIGLFLLGVLEVLAMIFFMGWDAV